MGQFRVRNGFAYGRENNFYSSIIAGGTSGLFAQGNTAPDVTIGTLFYTNNSAATTIKDFTLSHPSQGNGNLAGFFEGKEIRIIFLDSNTTVTGTRINLIGTDNTFAQNSFLELLYHTSSWYETSRSQNYTSQVPVVLVNSNGLNANYVTSFLMTLVSTGGISGTAVIQSISGGIVGQRLTLINNNSSAAIAISTAGNIGYSHTTGSYYGGSGASIQLALRGSGGSVDLYKVNNGQWVTLGY